MGDYLTQWVETTHKPPMARHNTYVLYKASIKNHLVPSLGRMLIHKLTAQQIQALYARKLQEGLAPGTVRLMHAILHKALDDAVKWGLIGRNVASLATMPVAKPHDIQPLTADGARKLIDAARDSKIETLLIVAVTTGMRRGEILSLRWNDIDLETGTLLVRHSVNRVAGYGFVENDPKNKTSRRGIMLPDVVIDSLKKHREKQGLIKTAAGSKWIEKGLVFPNTKGNFIHPDTLRETFNRVLKSAGLPHMRFHDLRHSAATILLTMGVHIKIVQELLGHSTITMTSDVYSHILPSMQKSAMDGWNGIL